MPDEEYIYIEQNDAVQADVDLYDQTQAKGGDVSGDIVVTGKIEGSIDVSNVHGLAPVATSGDYADLTGAPTEFEGATASADGTSGLVPAPQAGDQDKVLKGDGTWGSVEAEDVSVAWEDIEDKPSSFTPSAHATSATTYGVSSASSYGHAMASSTTPKAHGTAAVGSETAKFARGDHVHPAQTSISGNAGTASALASNFMIKLEGDVSGSTTTNGTGTATITAAVADDSHNHVISNVDGLQTALDGKAASSHSHAASDVTSGTFAVARIPSLNASKITAGTFDVARIPSLDASKIASGTIDIARLPAGALERLVTVANDAARFALTTADVQLGDTVKQLDTGAMYIVADTSKLGQADGYVEFTAGSATSVPWSGVTDKPSTFPPSSHSHGNLTNDGKIGSTANLPLITTTSGKVTTGSFGSAANTFCQGNDSRLSDSRTPKSHTHGNITNAGAIGSTSGLPVVTGANGVLQAGSFGATAGTVCEGNDSRLSDARTPTSHTHGSITNDGKLGTASRVVVTDGSKVIGVSSITTTKLGYLTDVTANIQGQIDGKADEATTLAGYGITDAKIASGTITLGSNTITPLTSASSLDASKLTGTASVDTTGKAATSGTADKVANKLTLKVKTGTTEGTDLYTYDGSGAKTLDIKQGSNITLAAAAGQLTIAGVGDTKNTAGSTDSSSKLFLIGATSQAANPQTYSHDTAYVGTDGCLYSGGTKVLTAHQDVSGKADDSAVVHKTGDETVAGTKTFSSQIVGTVGKSVGNGAYADMIQTFQSDNDGYRSCTIRCTNGDGYNTIFIGAHDESNNTPKGLEIINTDGNLVGSFSGSLRLTKSTDASGTADNSPALSIGSTSGTHLELDGNELMAKASGTTTGPLYLNAQGGDVYIGGNTGNYKAVTGRGKGSSTVPVYTNSDGIVTACGSSLDVDVSGNAATATKLATARTINGVSFDGSANITVADSTKLPLTGGTLTGTLYELASNVNLSVEPASAKEDYRFILAKNTADTVHTGNLMRLGATQNANTKDYRLLLSVSNPRGGNLPTAESIAEGDDDSDASTSNCWGGIGVYYDYSKNKAYPLVSGCSAYQNNDNGSTHLATTAWVRTATGDFACNAATATQFSANKSVTLTGDVTGTASSKAGWSIATTVGAITNAQIAAMFENDGVDPDDPPMAYPERAVLCGDGAWRYFEQIPF